MVAGAGEALSRLWHGSCSVTVRKGLENPLNKRTEFSESVLYQNVPCKLSFKLLYKTMLSTTDDDNACLVKQVANLFVAPDLVIPPGSKITVEQNGRTFVYEKSGQPALYDSHQEVPLQLFKGWA